MGPQEQVLGAALTLQCFPLSIFLRFATNRLEKLGAGSFVAMAQGRCAGGSVGWLGLPPRVCGSFSVRNLVLSWTGFKNVGDLHRELCWTLGWQQGSAVLAMCFCPPVEALGAAGPCWWEIPSLAPRSHQISHHVIQGRSDTGWFRVQNKISWEAMTNGQRKERGDVLGPRGMSVPLALFRSRVWWRSCCPYP